MFGQYSPIWVCLKISLPLNSKLFHHFPSQNCHFWNFPISDNALAIASSAYSHGITGTQVSTFATPPGHPATRPETAARPRVSAGHCRWTVPARHSRGCYPRPRRGEWIFQKWIEGGGRVPSDLRMDQSWRNYPLVMENHHF